MNLIDLFLFFIIIMAVFSGYRKGFIYGFLDLLLLAVGLALAFSAYRYLASFLEKYFTPLGAWTLPIAFILSYVIARALLGILARTVVNSISPKAMESRANKTLGVFPGFVNGVLYAAIISALLLGLPLFDGLSSRTRDSAIAHALLPHVEWAEEKLAPVFDDAINHSINKLTVDPESGKSVDLRFTVTNPEVREDLEARMLVMVNEERRKEGLPPLDADPEVRVVARAHSRDMFAKGYFAHVNKEGLTPAQRARKAGVRYLVFGENLALAQTLRIAHDGLMNSPGHRANILNRSYGRVGIGILEGGRYGLMITQNFRN